MSEAVGIDEYVTNIRTALAPLSEASRRVVVLGEPPIGWNPSVDVPAANRDLAEHNQRARRAAHDAGLPIGDLGPLRHQGDRRPAPEHHGHRTRIETNRGPGLLATAQHPGSPA
jgi:hypothetical protein